MLSLITSHSVVVDKCSSEGGGVCKVILTNVNKYKIICQQMSANVSKYQKQVADAELGPAHPQLVLSYSIIPYLNPTPEGGGHTGLWNMCM